MRCHVIAVAKSQPEIAERLYAQLVAWREAIEAPMPTQNLAPKTENAGKRKAAKNKAAAAKQQQSQADN